MKHSNPGNQLPPPDSDRSNAELQSHPGGYHSRGVPGEEGEVRKRTQVLKVGDKSRINKSRPLKGGAGAEQASIARLDAGQPDLTGDNEATAGFVIAKKGVDFLDTPVFHAGESGDQEAVAVFTTRKLAQQYLDRAGWEQTDEVGELSLGDLLDWLTDANREGVRYATVNPDRDRHLAGDPQAVLSLEALAEESAESLFRQVTELARD